MAKEVKNSYKIKNNEGGRLQEQGLASFYFNNTFGAIKSLGITSVRDISNKKSDMPSARFLNTLVDTREWLEYKALHYAKKNQKFGKLETLLRNDPLSKDAARYQWHGLFQPEDQDSEEHYQYVAFSVVWQDEKITKFKELVENYWKQQQSQPKESEEPTQPTRAKKILFYLGKRAVDLFLFGLVAVPVGYSVYHGYIKPDIKTEIKDSIPYIPTPNDIVDTLSEKVYPDIEEIIKKNNDLSNERIDKIIDENIDRAIDRLAEKIPWIEDSKEQLRSKIKEKIDEKYKQQEKKQESNPEEQPHNKEEGF